MRGLLLLPTLVFLAQLSSAQSVPTTAVHVRVLDSAGVAIGNANVSIVRGLTNTVVAGSTSARGEVTLTVPAGLDYELVARRIGYERTSRFFSATAEPIALTVQLARHVTQLDAVAVTSSGFSRKEKYRLGADEIAASTRPVYDGFDVIAKIRPAILDPSPRSKYNACPTENIWVNGMHVTQVPVDQRMLLDLRHKYWVRQATIPLLGGVTPQPPSGMLSVGLDVLSTLASIRAEHIEEVNYSDCEDNSVDRTHASAAIFITLKQGIGFQVGRGTYVVESAVALAPNRLRIVGVFDQVTGAPLAGVEITDSASHAFVTTTETGTATLAFLSDGAHVIWLRKKGYAEMRVPVAISVTDSLPLTLTLMGQR